MFLLVIVLWSHFRFGVVGDGTFCRFTKRPAQDIFVLRGKTFKVEWNFEADIQKNSGVFIQLFQPANVLLYGIHVETNRARGTRVVHGPPYYNRITWTGNTTANIASFVFYNVTRDLSFRYYIAWSGCKYGNTTDDTMDLHVVDPPRFAGNETFRKIIVKESQTLNETCTTIAEPPMTVYWTKNGERKSSEGHVSSTLILSKIKRSDDGTYICQGTSSIGKINLTLSVVVFYPATINHLRSSPAESYIGQVATLNCFFEGNPKPSVRWIAPNPAGKYSYDSTGILRVKFNTSADFGKYECVVNNSIGNDNGMITIKELVVPGEVGLLSIHTGIQKVSFEWAAPKDNGGSSVQSYVITITGGSKDREPHYVNSTRFFIRNLSENTSYIFCVAALNEAGSGKKRCTNTTTLSDATPTLSTSSRPAGKPSSSAGSGDGNVITIIFVVIATVLVIIVIVLTWMLLKRRRRRRNGNLSESNTLSLVKKMGSSPRMNDDIGESHVIEVESSHKGIYETPLGEYEILPDEYENPKSENKLNGEKWELEREKLEIKKVIGKGSFGQVAKGVLRVDTEEGWKEQVVAVKMVKDDCPDSDKKDLLSELKIMKSLAEHPNVIRLLGCVTRTEPLFVVIAFVPFGDLLGYLRKSRGKHDNYFNDPDIKPKTNLSSKELMRFARDIACGMEFLALNKVVHRDLAARNVLVGEEHVCKITDFGMARDVYQDNIYTKTSKGRIPVKWTAYESLMYNKYTTQSDVWSYGIILFEIFTIGGTPYPGVKSRDVCSLIKNGYRMEKPAHVNEKLYSVMSNCWETEPERRPTFSCLKQTMSDMEREDEDYVNLRAYNSSLYENFENLE